MNQEAPVQSHVSQETQAQLVRDALKKIRAGESQETVLMGLPEDLRKKVEEELNREETNKEEKTPSNELIPAQFHGLTSTALLETWVVDEKTVEGELEKNRKIKALEALRREEVQLVHERAKEIERAAREQGRISRIGEVRRELGKEDSTPNSPVVRISEEELTRMLTESTSRDSFRDHLNNHYTRELSTYNIDVAEMVRNNPDAVPSFAREDLQQKYGTKE